MLFVGFVVEKCWACRYVFGSIPLHFLWINIFPVSEKPFWMDLQKASSIEKSHFLTKQHWRHQPIPARYFQNAAVILKNCDLFATGLLATMTSIEVFRFSWCGMVGAWWSLDWCQHPWGRWIWTSMASSSPWAAQNAAWWFDWWGKRIHSRMREWLDYIRVSIGSLCICKVVFNMMVLF